VLYAVGADERQGKHGRPPHATTAVPLSLRLFEPGRSRTCATSSRSTSRTAGPRRAPASGSPPGPCSTAGCSAVGSCGTLPSRSGNTGCARASRRRRTSTRHARRSRAAPIPQRPSSSSDSSPRYCFAAFRPRDDRLQKYCLFILDERYEVYLLLARRTTKMRCTGVAAGFGCSRMSSRSPRSMWTTSSNPRPRSALSFAFFASSPSKYFTVLQRRTTCAHETQIGPYSSSGRSPAALVAIVPHVHTAGAGARS
jgi:hypothetical protein